MEGRNPFHMILSEVDKMLWKEIENLEKYLVSDTGLIQNKKTGNIIKPALTNNGYQMVSLYIGKGKSKRFYVHRLVAIAFLPNPDNLTDVNHKDYDKQNNSVNNLEWCTRSDNLKHSYNYENRNKNREHAKELAEKNHEKMKIKVIQKALSGEFIAEYNSLREAEEKTGIPIQNISSVTQGKRRSAGGYIWERSDGIDFEYNPTKHFSAVQQLDLNNNVIAEYYSMADAARATGINSNNISAVCTGKRKTTGGFKWRKI